MADEAENPVPGKIYTCHPIQNYAFGRKFKFEKGQMTLYKDADIKEFDELLTKLPSVERARIKTVNVDIANKLAASIPLATRGFDGGVNPAVEKVRQEFPKFGTQNDGTKESGNQ